MKSKSFGKTSMPLGFEYRCDACDYEWMLFSTGLSIGPTQWGFRKFTCFSCQTFLSISKTIDRNSWKVWLENNQSSLINNTLLNELKVEIDRRLDNARGLTPVKLDFNSMRCPTCQKDDLLELPFGEHPMRCPQCLTLSGNSINNDRLSIYRFE